MLLQTSIGIRLGTWGQGAALVAPQIKSFFIFLVPYVPLALSPGAEEPTSPYTRRRQLSGPALFRAKHATMRRAALFSLFTINAYVLDLELDGTYAPLRFAINDDLNQIARAWRQKHPSMTGGDCDEGDGRCVEDVLVRAMEARFDARHVISNAAIHCKLPGHAFPSEKLSDAVGTPDESYALEQAAGFCYCAADRNFVGNRTGGISAASVAMDAAGLALRLEPRRARAARFGMLAGQDLFDVADATAYFARRFAELKWPPDGSLPSLVLGGSLDLSVTLEPRVAWSPSVEESRSHVQIRVEP